MSQTPGRLRRLAEELAEIGLDLSGLDRDALIEEVDHALRPSVHERRTYSSGSIIHPTEEPETWESDTGLAIFRASAADQPLDIARRFADGSSSWILRHPNGPIEWVVFDRPAGSERDLGIIARTTGGTVVQRDAAGIVRIVGGFGVLRWDGFDWHLEPPIESWIDIVHNLRCHP